MPLPKGLLEYDSPEDGLLLKLNNTDEDLETNPKFGIFLWRNDWPLGLVEPGGGSLIEVAGYGEAELIEWAKKKTRKLEAAKN